MAPPSLWCLSVGELIAEAGVDPWTLQDQLLSGRPGDIDDLAFAFHKAAQYVAEGDSIFAQARSHFRGAYHASAGVDTINDSREVQRAQDEFALTLGQLKRISDDLEDIAAGLTDAQNATHPLIDGLNANVRDFDTRAEMMVTNQPAYETVVLEAVAAVAAVAAAGAELNSIHAGYESLLDAKMSDIEANGYTPAVNLSDAADTAPIPANGTDPVKVNQWWKSLGAGERQRILSEHPDQIGNLNGIPVIDRSAANEEVMQRDIDKVLDAKLDSNRMDPKKWPEGIPPFDPSKPVTTEEVVANPALFGLNETDITRYKNAMQVQQGLESDREGTHDPAVTYLYKYRPQDLGGRGAAAIAIGNPDTADNTTVVVPGTGSSVANGWLSSKDALNVYNQAAQADPHHSTAVVAWMGYQTPDSPEDPRIASPNLARQASPVLAADVNGLWASHDSAVPSHVTVSGHSYGSTTVADAAVNGMHANDVVLVGCPGTDLAHSAADFHLDGGHVYVGDASADPVGEIGEYQSEWTAISYENLGGHPLGLGIDPASDTFGATRFEAQVPGNTGELDPNFDAHLHYYDVGDESLHNIVTIATGHADHVETAPLREHVGFDFFGKHLGLPGTPDSYDREVGRAAHTGQEFNANIPGKHY